MVVNVHTDGGSRGNPGDAAIGFVVFEEDTPVFEHSAYIGTATNNEAEYQALFYALEWLKNNQEKYLDTEVIFKLDSKLVVEQINRNWKIKEERMRNFAQKCWQIIDSLPFSPAFTHVRRELNKEADALVNQALDNHAK